MKALFGIALISSMIASISTFLISKRYMENSAVEQITIIDYQAKTAAKQLSNGTIKSIPFAIYDRAEDICSNTERKSRFQFQFISALDDFDYRLASYECTSEGITITMMPYSEIN